MDDKSWDFYDNIRFDVLQFCQILLGKPCSGQDCLEFMKQCGTYDDWLVSMKHLIGISNYYPKQTELEDAILDGLMNIKKPFSNPEAIIFQRCLLYEKRCSEMKVNGESDAMDLFDFILKHALKKEIPEDLKPGPAYPLFDSVSIWISLRISLNNDLEDYWDKNMEGVWVLLSDKTLAKLSKAEAAIQSYVNDEILSLEISDEEKEQLVGELFGSDAVANMPKKKDESEKAQKDFLRKLWDIYKDESTRQPKVREKGQNPAVEFSIVAYYIWYDEFKSIKDKPSKYQFYKWLDDTKDDNSFNNLSAYNTMSLTYYSKIGNSSTLEEAKEYVNDLKNKAKTSSDRKDNEKRLKQIEEFLKLKDIYREKLKEKRDNNERKA